MSMRQKGQTSVEYMLMIVVAITIGIAFKKKMEEYFVRNPNSFINKSINNYRVIFQRVGPNGKPYSYFPVYGRGNR